MWPHALAAARFALRTPMSYGLLAIGAFLAWFGVALAVLALDVSSADHTRVVTATAELAAAILVVWLLQRTLDEDAGSGFTAATDATRPGAAGRLLGRWAGCVLCAALLAVGTRLVASALCDLSALSSLPLYITSIGSLALVGAWGVLLGSRGGGGLLPLIALGLWVAGHLPWGAPGWAPGLLGDALSAWLPGPVEGPWLRAFGVRVVVSAALLLLAVGLARPASQGDG